MYVLIEMKYLDLVCVFITLIGLWISCLFPLYRQSGHLGNIFLISNNTATSLNSILSVHGTSQEAYFGFSLLTVDLNGDGLDELLVSAPIYSLPGQTEIGQVHVFTNDGVS